MGVRDADVERLYVELGPALLAYARSIVPSRAEAEDALQQVFLKLITSNGLPHEPRPYLFRAVRNTCLNRRRSVARELACDTLEPAMFTAPVGLEAVRLEIEDAIKELPLEQREVVTLKVWGGMTLEQVAQVLDVPLNTAASRYRYAVGKLRSRFGAHLKK
jgi:RNA polymerase sigma-70 factor (ECF subfamily)